MGRTKWSQLRYLWAIFDLSNIVCGESSPKMDLELYFTLWKGKSISDSARSPMSQLFIGFVIWEASVKRRGKRKLTEWKEVFKLFRNVFIWRLRLLLKNYFFPADVLHFGIMVKWDGIRKQFGKRILEKYPLFRSPKFQNTTQQLCASH